MGVVAINIVEFGSLLFCVTKNFRNFSKKEKSLEKCTKVVPQRSKDLGPRYVSQTMNYQEKLKCGLVNGRQKILWSKQALRRNFTHMCASLIWRASCQISASNIITLLIPL